MPRRTTVEVEGSRSATLDEAVQLASVVGLEGLTIGGLADRLGMSKSGLIGRFGSKQQLQLATLERAAEIFRVTVYAPALSAAPGLARLNAICDAWVAYLGDPPFQGGCFLTTAVVEFDARQGPVRDAVRDVMHRWLAALEREATEAIKHGELLAEVDAQDAAFTLNALAVGANCDLQLNHNPETLARTRRAMARALMLSS